MNRKSIYSLILAVALAVSFAFPVYADLASDSDADYFSIKPMALTASAYDSPIYARVGNTFTRLQYDSTMSYITVPANADCLRWDVTGDMALSVEPVDNSNLNLFYQIQAKQTVNNEAHWSVYNVSDFKNGGALHVGASGTLSVYFMLSPVSLSNKMKVISYPASNMSSLSVKIGGVYNSEDKQISFSNQIGGRYIKCIGPVVASKYSVYRFPSGGILRKGYEYNFTFYAEYAGHYVYADNIADYPCFALTC